ncbi:MAG: hypothetical protein FWE67_07315 [Planctomycetaceae bacterium]|nr:hypothetical protein [Planctomycetaceae bacterium]
MKKTSKEYQTQFVESHPQLYDKSVKDTISSSVILHSNIESPGSSAAACLNVLGYLNLHQEEIFAFFRCFDLKIERVIPFPTGANVGGEIYDDRGPIVFEWIGPKNSPINEVCNSGRGIYRTCFDAFLLAEIDGKVTQILIEWKFTEKKYNRREICYFAGLSGMQRLWRYSDILIRYQDEEFPFRFEKLKDIGHTGCPYLGLSDCSYEPFYQLLRMTLLAKETTPIFLSDVNVEDYRIVHLIHSDNEKLLTVQREHLQYSPGLLNVLDANASKNLHELWKMVITEKENKRFVCGFWDKAISVLQEDADYVKYLRDRYVS